MIGTSKKPQIYWKNAVILIFKIAIGSGLSWEAAKLAGSKHPYLAPLSLILCLQPTVQQSIQYSFERVIGTLVGVCITALVAGYFHLNGWTLALLLLIGTWIASLLKLKENVLHEAAFSILLVFALSPSSGQYPFDRIRDTLIGVVLAFLLHTFVFPPNFTKEAGDALRQYAADLSDRFLTMSGWIQNGCPKNEEQMLEQEIGILRKSLSDIGKKVDKAGKSLNFNPYAKTSRTQTAANRQQLQHAKRALDYLEKLVTVMRQWSDSGAMSAADQSLWADQTRGIGLHWQQGKERAQPIPLRVMLPPGLEPYQYPVTLYSDTAALLQQLRQ